MCCILEALQCAVFYTGTVCCYARDKVLTMAGMFNFNNQQEQKQLEDIFSVKDLGNKNLSSNIYR